MCVRKFVYAAVLAVVGVLAAPPTAKAAFLLQLTSGSNTVTIDLENVPASNSANGYTYQTFFLDQTEGVSTAVFGNLKFGGYTISADTNVTNKPGDAQGGNLSLNGLTVTRDTGGSSEDDLTIALTATGYTAPKLQKTLDSNFDARLNTNATVTPIIDFRSSFAFGDVEFGEDISDKTTTEGTNFGPKLPFEPFSESMSTSLGTNTGTYSLTNVTTITGLGFGKDNRLDNAGVSSLVTPQLVPAPAGLILVAGVVPFLGLLRRRMRAAQPAQDVGSAA